MTLIDLQDESPDILQFANGALTFKVLRAYSVLSNLPTPPPLINWQPHKATPGKEQYGTTT